MSSPSKYVTNSPVRRLEERYYSRPLDIILEEDKIRNSLAIQNSCLVQQNEKLYEQYNRSKVNQNQYASENIKLKKENELLERDYRNQEGRYLRELELKNKEIEDLNRDLKLVKDQYEREMIILKEQIRNLNTKNLLLEKRNLQDVELLKKKYISSSIEETNLIKKNMNDDIKKILGDLEVTKQILAEKQKQFQHLVIVSHRNSEEYSANLQQLISQNNVLRNKLISSEIEKNKEIQFVENKKQLEKSRTIGILSYCKENNSYIEKQLTRLNDVLNEKNIALESNNKEVMKLKSKLEQNEKRHEEILNKLKLGHIEQIKEKEQGIQKIEKFYKEELGEQKKIQIGLEERLATKQHQLDTVYRSLQYANNQLAIKNKQIEDYKDNISKLHDDHSKELSKVMLDSKVKRKSGLNISSYSSSSLKDIQQAQGSSIIKSGRIERRSSISNEGSSGLPTVKQELAASHGHIQDQDEDIQVKELILHYQSMIEQIKKNKTTELDLSNQKIEALKVTLNEKQQEILDILNRFSPLMEFKVNQQSIDEERKQKIEQHYKADLDILSVMLDKYQIVSLRPKK